MAADEEAMPSTGQSPIAGILAHSAAAGHV